MDELLGYFQISAIISDYGINNYRHSESLFDDLLRKKLEILFL